MIKASASFLRALVAVVAAALTVVGALQPQVAASTDDRFTPLAALAGTTRVVVPAGFKLPAADAGLRLTHVIATDLDADGDMDVVASDGFAHLFVWVNDGDGHFTRKKPVAVEAWRPTAPVPSFSDRQAGTFYSVQTSGAPATTDSRRVSLVLASEPFRPRGRPDVASIALRTLRSRAPPASSL